MGTMQGARAAGLRHGADGTLRLRSRPRTSVTPVGRLMVRGPLVRNLAANDGLGGARAGGPRQSCRLGARKASGLQPVGEGRQRWAAGRCGRDVRVPRNHGLPPRCSGPLVRNPGVRPCATVQTGSGRLPASSTMSAPPGIQGTPASWYADLWSAIREFTVQTGSGRLPAPSTMSAPPGADVRFSRTARQLTAPAPGSTIAPSPRPGRTPTRRSA
jgi:hypothetical protein